ncbi:MAG: deoxyguanosinetriphosphate triphosphohydrolase [Anaerolineae bacterium]
MFRTRAQLEEMEFLLLAPYATKSRESRGRAFPEEEHPYRTAFQRDRDRIVHTTAFRRLEYKTQVFLISEGDHYRTRLTHTLEVAQIGRTLARALGANEDLTEAICLAHDLGHTPFGHSGEETLHELMADHGGFDHNLQSLRIVEMLEKTHEEYDGLNLTWEVREGIVKHRTEYDRGEFNGYEPDLQPTLEGQIVNLADEIAYNSHDLDDGIRAGLIKPGDLQDLALWRDVLASLGLEETPREIGDLLRREAVRRLIHLEVTDVVETTARHLQEHGIASPEEVRAFPEPVARFSPALEARNRELKDFLMRRVYRHYRVNRMAAKAKRLLTDLFRAYVEDPSQLPEPTQARLRSESLHRVVCDYIAGMTDRYAQEEYQKLFDPLERV